MNEQLRRLIPQARTLITKESFRDQSFGSLEGYVEDLRRPIDLTPLVRVVHRAMSKYPRQSEESDGWLAPRVHASLRLFRSEAADQGIWDYLSVVVLRDYVLWRMAGEDGLVNDVDRIVGPFRHQAVARLWWAAELSRNGGDYRPTEQAFSSQDAVNYLTNVDAFHNRPAALAYIRFISHRSGTTPIKQMAVETGKTLNHVLTTLVLDSIAPDSGGDLDAHERWIAEAPDARLMDSALPKGPDEPQVPEAKIRAVEQLLERLMEEHRWHEVVVWSERWVATAQSPELVETALPIIPSPGGNGSKDSVVKDAVEKDSVVRDAFVKDASAKGAVQEDGVVKDALTKDFVAKGAVEEDVVVRDARTKDAIVKDAVLYERFVEALRDDLGVESSDQTRDLFEKLSKELALGGGTVAAQSEERALSGETVVSQFKGEKIVDSIPTPALTVPLEAGARGGAEPNARLRGDHAVREVSPAAVPLGGAEPIATPQGDHAVQVVSLDGVVLRDAEPRSTGEPSLKGYAELSSMRGSIAATAESVYQKFPPEQQTLARRIFLQLTELGEGSLDMPRRAAIGEFALRPQEAQVVDAMLKMLADARLITSEEASVQIADNALIRDWKRLRDWLDEDREGLRLHRHLAQAAQAWEMSQRDPSVLYRGARLAQALEWAKADVDEPSTREREFLDAAKEVAEREGQSLADAETRRAEEEHRVAMQWRRRALYLAAAIIIVPIIIAVVVYFAH